MPDRMPGAASGRTIWRRVAMGPAPEVPGRLQERPIEPLQADVDGQDHERQVVVDDAQRDREGRVQELDVTEPDPAQDARHAVGPEQGHPGVGPDEEARPERDDDQGDEDELPAAPDLEGQDVGDREGHQQADDRVERGQPERVGQRRDARAQVGVLLEGEGRRVAAVGRALADRHHAEHDQGQDEEAHVPQERGQGEQDGRTAPWGAIRRHRRARAGHGSGGRLDAGPGLGPFGAVVRGVDRVLEGRQLRRPAGR